MILDDDEIPDAETRHIEWRTENVFELRSLFRTTKSKFPFQRAAANKIAGNLETSSRVVWPNYKSLMEVDWTPTPEEIAEFGIPLLPLPMLQLPDDNFDEDGDPRYAACTPPNVSWVCEKEAAATTVDSKDVVCLGPDIHDISGNLG
jgi:hypothetical protein